MLYTRLKGRVTLTHNTYPGGYLRVMAEDGEVYTVNNYDSINYIYRKGDEFDQDLVILKSYKKGNYGNQIQVLELSFPQEETGL